MPRQAPAHLAQAVLVALALSAGVAVAAPPTPASCSDPDLGDRLKCKVGNLVAQQEDTADMLNQMSEIPDAQKTAIMNKKERNRRVFDSSSSADFKQLAKKKNPECQIAEDPNGSGDHDGICTGNEDCLEVIGDQIGDDIQPCRRNGKPADREVCVQICDEQAVDSNPDNFDEAGRGKDLEDELDDAVGQYEVINQMLDQVLALRARPPIALSGTGCSTMLDSRPANGVLWAVLLAKLTGETISNISDKFCGQTVAGTNSSIACVVVVVATSAAVDAWEILDNIDNNRDSDGIDASYACLQAVNKSVGDGNKKGDAIEAKVDSLDMQVKMLQQELDEVKTLLLTPAGKRPGFPTSH